MWVRSRLDSVIKSLAIFSSALCAVGAAAAFFVILVRLPAIASTKLDLLLGTLQGVAVGLLFAIAALLINLTYMVRRANRKPTHPLVSDGRISAGQSGPSA
jgi:hypothetical protein